MYIVIDARMVTDQMHGIARYTYNLVNRLVRIDQKNYYTLLVNGSYFSVFKDIKTNVSLQPVRSKFISIGEQIELPVILKKLKADLFHSPSFVAPLYPACKLIMTIHDMNHMSFPQYYSMIHQLYYQYIVKPSAVKAKKIITVSQFSRKEINRWLGVPREKIKVTYNGVEDRYTVIDDLAALREVNGKYRLPEKFILYIGNKKPHKNVGRLIEAYAKLKTNYYLILSGDPDEQLNTLVSELDLAAKVKFIGNVPDQDLPQLYNLADLFVFPSLYEGFGLPPLEAMACGTPVITSNVSSLPEVVGEAGITVNPNNVDELANAINKVLVDEKLRKNMIEEGLKQARKFNWETTARETLDIYEEALKS